MKAFYIIYDKLRINISLRRIKERRYDHDQKDAYRFFEDLKDIEEKLTELSQTEEALKNQYREVKSSLDSLDDGFDDCYYPDYSSDELEYFVDDIAGLTGMLTHAFEEKKKKKRR